MKRTLLALVLTAGIALTGCSSSSTSASSSSAAARGSAAATPSKSGDPVLEWCVAYSQITTALSQAPSTVEGATTSLNALGTFDPLWTAAVKLGFITEPEADANHRAVAAYTVLVQAVADGKTAKDKAVIDAQNNLAKATTNDAKDLASSATKVNALCAPLTAGATPSGAPASSAPSAPASVGPSSSSSAAASAVPSSSPS